MVLTSLIQVRFLVVFSNLFVNINSCALSDEDVVGETKQHQDLLEQYRKSALEKQKRQQSEGSEEDGNDDEETPADVETLVKLQAENRRKERQRKRAEYEKQQSHNFLFTDEQLMEALSSSSEDEEG